MSVYFIYNHLSNAVKIGYSEEPSQRLKTIKTNSPGKNTILIICDGDRELEKYYHQLYAEYRINPDQEWFYPSEMMAFQIGKTLWEDRPIGLPIYTMLAHLTQFGIYKDTGDTLDFIQWLLDNDYDLGPEIRDCFLDYQYRKACLDEEVKIFDEVDTLNWEIVKFIRKVFPNFSLENPRFYRWMAAIMGYGLGIQISIWLS